MFGLFGTRKEEKIAEGVEQPLAKFNVLLTQKQIDHFQSAKRIVFRRFYEKHLDKFFTTEQISTISGELNEFAKKCESDKESLVLANFLQQKIQEFAKYFPLKHYLVDDFAVYRHLKEYGWSEGAAINGMIKAVLWHIKEKTAINPKYSLSNCPEVKEMAKTGYFYTSGFDKGGRAVMYLLLGKDSPKTDENTKDVKYRHIVNVFENAMFQIMKKNGLLIEKPEEKKEGIKNPFQAQVSWIGEAQNFPVSVNYVMTIKTVIDKFGQMHAESSGRMIICNIPFISNLIIPLIKPFLSKEQQEKYVFISGSKSSVRNEILKHIPEDQLPSEFYDGKSNINFNLQKLLELDNERLETMKKLSENMEFSESTNTEEDTPSMEEEAAEN